MSNIRFLTERISYRVGKDSTSIVITGKVERWKEAALAAWVVAWTASGVYFMTQLNTDLPDETKMGIVIMLFFWVYFEIKIGRALLWRLWGVEQLRFSAGRLTIKNSIRGYGKRRDYFLDNIRSFETIAPNPRSVVASMEESFWVVGGERIYFEHLGKQVGLGRQLSAAEVNKLMELMQRLLKKYRE